MKIKIINYKFQLWISNILSKALKFLTKIKIVLIAFTIVVISLQIIHKITPKKILPQKQIQKTRNIIESQKINLTNKLNELNKLDKKIQFYTNTEKYDGFHFFVSQNLQKYNRSNIPNILVRKNNLFQNLINFEHSIFKFINLKLNCKFLNFCMRPISYCDSINFNISFFTILTISLVILWKNKKDTFLINLVLLASIIIFVGIITYFLKQYFKRLRPMTLFGDENVNHLFEKNHFHSFPSGHTASSVAICVFMFMNVKKYWYWYVIFAILSGFYRIYTGNHFPCDVLAGILIGFFSSYIVITIFRKFKVQIK
ncbi:MAG: phosphatase PAP2 family protein [Endomicrobium sp.]|jgi:undecaprenyl-diphosphatase|nr:phosphatase PAP2 family protein [Endomicrobium sp.]